MKKILFRVCFLVLILCLCIVPDGTNYHLAMYQLLIILSSIGTMFFIVRASNGDEIREFLFFSIMDKWFGKEKEDSIEEKIEEIEVEVVEDSEDPLKYYETPFINWDNCYIATRDNNMALQAIKYRSLEEIISVLNGLSEPTSQANYNPEDQVISIDGEQVLLVRGWGRLKSVIGLTPVEAAKVQDSFGEWVANKLTRKQ